jgi:uncharacterized protein YceH (UPF0502 family)
MPPTRSLDFEEIRVLGALLEKEQTTPDQYPLSINALILACNQKTNREPVTSLSETQVVEAVDRLRIDALTWRVSGARAERWQQNVDRRWHLNPGRKALMTLLLLRGPQTPGELKSRAERMFDFPSVEEVERTLQQMAAGEEDALVRELSRRPGQRETRWIHLFASAEAQRQVEAAFAAPAYDEEAPPPRAERGGGGAERLAALEAALRDLEAEVTELRDELREMKAKLGDLL